MPKRVRIAFIEQDAGIGGAEVNLFYLFNGMDKDLFYPLVIVPFEGPLTERLKELDVQFYVIPRAKFMSTSNYIFGKKIFNPFSVLYDIMVFVPAILRIKTFLKKEQINVVHTNSIVAHVYGAIAARLAGVPCIWHMQDIVDPKMAFGLVRRALAGMGGILPKKIVVVSKAVGEMFSGKSASKVHVIYNGADCMKFSSNVDGSAVRKEFGINSNEFVVGMVGRLTQWKGQREFLKAASMVAAHKPNVKFLIVGETTFGDPGYKDELRRLADQTGLSSNVIFTGFRNDIPQLTSAMDICVLPSILPDPCPLVLFDYMASAKPVVASRTGGIPEIIEDGKDGFLVEPGNPEELAKSIIRLLKDKALRLEIGEAARDKAVEQYSVETFVRNFEKVYGDLAL